MARWFRNRPRFRRWLGAGLIAGLGVIGTAASSFVAGQLKGLGEYAVSVSRELTCRFSNPSQSAAGSKPVILLTHFGDDPNDQMRQRVVKILYDETDFDVISSCMRFETNGFASIEADRSRFLANMSPQIRAAAADVLLFGTVYLAGKVKLWSSSPWGECDWRKSDAVDLDDQVAATAVSSVTRSALYRTILNALASACNHPHNADWSVVASNVDKAFEFVQRKQALFTYDDYLNAHLQFHALFNFPLFSGWRGCLVRSQQAFRRSSGNSLDFREGSFPRESLQMAVGLALLVQVSEIQ